MIDLTKPVQTRGGRKARIVSMDRKHSDSIVGLVMKDDGTEEILCWSRDGTYLCDEISEDDLINVPAPKKKVTVDVGLWVDEAGVVSSCSQVRRPGIKMGNSRWIALASLEIEYEEPT